MGFGVVDVVEFDDVVVVQPAQQFDLANEVFADVPCVL